MTNDETKCIRNIATCQTVTVSTEDAIFDAMECEAIKVASAIAFLIGDEDGQSDYECAGTPKYMAPEVATHFAR